MNTQYYILTDWIDSNLTTIHAYHTDFISTKNTWLTRCNWIYRNFEVADLLKRYFLKFIPTPKSVKQRFISILPKLSNANLNNAQNILLTGKHSVARQIHAINSFPNINITVFTRENHTMECALKPLFSHYQWLCHRLRQWLQLTKPS